ncbi:MAG: DNA polymerase IV [Geminicoccaceae bacterium]|nr:DNA polymerase IV [Geminicoccaceae bacterium]
MSRKIVHVDMDAFYAAIEQRDDPRLRGRPVAVGGSGPRAVVATASYEARAFGIRSAMPMARARLLCPDLVVVPPRFETYRAESRRIRAILRRWSSLVEPLSLDEAYLDVTEPLPGPMPALEVARLLKLEIRAATGLTASAGVSCNKLLAKLASGHAKPDGLTLVRPQEARNFMAALPVEAIHGIGPKSAARLHRLGIATGADLQQRDPAELVATFGRIGLLWWNLAHGRDDRPVEPDRPRRSLGIETTFARDLVGPAALEAALRPLAHELDRRAHRAGFRARTLVLKIKHADFRLATRSLTLARPPEGPSELIALARRLLHIPAPPAGPVRLLGLSLCLPNRVEDPRQLPLELAEPRDQG